MFIKNIYYFLHYYLRKKTSEPYIRKIDKELPIQKLKATSELNNKGVIKGKVKDLINDYFISLCAEATKDYKDYKDHFDSFGTSINRRIPLEIISNLLASKNLNKYIYDYLGENARLDDAYFWKKNERLSTNFDLSEGWHTDNVGHRLKLFICIDATEQSPYTQVLESKHKNLYRAPLGDWRRFFGKVGSPVKGKVVDLKYSAGNFALFDTNMQHRGVYKNLKGERNCLVAEFSIKEKSNRLAGKCPCGPGQSKEGVVYFTKNNTDQLKLDEISLLPLIDNELLKENNEHISYTISNRTNAL